MNRGINLPLIVIGAVLILAPLLTHSLTSATDRNRIATFHLTNPALPTPTGLKPSDNAGYEWACFGIGVAIAFKGIRESSEDGSKKPEPWEHAEV